MNKKWNSKGAVALLLLAGLLSSGSLPGSAEELEQLPLRTNPLPTRSVDTGTTGAAEGSIAPPMQDLPVTPEQAEADKKVILSGGAAAGNFNLVGAAAVVSKSPLTRYEGPKLKFVEVTIRNNGSYPVVIVGENSRGIGNSVNVAPLNLETLVKLNDHIFSRGDKLAVAAISAGTAGLAGPIAYEMLTAKDHRKRNLGTAVGRDAGRHEIEESRLNRRVILPQDETKGWLAFLDNESANVNSLLVPLIYPYNNSNGSVNIPINSVKSESTAARKVIKRAD